MAERLYAPGESYRYQLIIKHLLETPLFFAPDQEIVYRDRVRLTYRKLNERIHRLANGLAKLGVNPGDRVCVFDYDSHRYLECFFAVPMMGAVLHTQNWRLSPEQILYTMNHAEDKIVLVHEDFLPLLESIYPQLMTVEKIVLISDSGRQTDTRLPVALEYEELLRGVPGFCDFPDLDENARGTIFYTTGTTGLPKGVHFSHRQLVLNAQAQLNAAAVYESVGRFRSNDVYMPLTPMFHVHAWGFPYVATLLGVKQVYPGKYEAPMLLNLIVKEKVTFSHCVPTIVHMLLTSPAAATADLSRWRVTVGGARLPRGLAREAMNRGIEIYTGYGMSEACPLISVANLKPPMLGWEKEKQLDRLIMTGLPVPFVYARIVDAKGKFLPRDGVATGELVIRTPWLTESYYKDPERSKELWRDGWLHTGDVAYIDPEGYIQITDRLKDVIKTGGEWVSSLDLENLISQHPAVSEAAAIGVPDGKWGERPLLVVVLRPDFRERVEQKDIVAFMAKWAEAGRLPKYAVPDKVLLVEGIPKTSVGKIDKVALRKKYG
ncbi:MAG: fatty acid--CoA ligase [Deltaproteobacteria bacterium]|nr:fatty acid--CoA ligase [Deltaproteobacteria bacterium]